MYNSFKKHDIGTIVQIINKNNTRMYYRVKHEFVKLPIKLLFIWGQEYIMGRV